ncbi:SDR family oxidoreductase [Roseomonas sp. SSH11]|uniref:SDR family oxidoreductase n=1 Tax=Pararoseomonas baculiformis TaxID=2820812 RepID=A0ABS4A850_9PROT|nr:SDR family oxidoreductase [Pararoseomonas baculiformis]MBP0443181.1 SDR family oxidoreductase [Pararoseomonas baculiformis]
MAEGKRVALVTGGSNGIGRGITKRLAADGWHVVTADTEAKGPEEAARHVQADISDEAAVRALVDGIAGTEARLDGLVANAGIMIRKPLRDLTLEEWSRVIGTNLTSTYLLARATESLLRQARGAIVTIASTRAHQSEPDTESYAASKGGLVALTHALAISLGPDVRANVISPGWIDVSGEKLRERDHAQHPAGRVGEPADIAALAAWLLSPESGFVTGAEFISDGGMTRKMIYED